jgi:hypothetical protein
VNRKLDDSTSAYLFGAIGSGFRVAFPEVGEDARRGQPDGVPTHIFTLSIPDMSEEFVVHDLYKERDECKLKTIKRIRTGVPSKRPVWAGTRSLTP